MMFDPTVYQSANDYQREPELSDEEWCKRFAAYIVAEGEKYAADSFKAELAKYGADTARSYLPDRKEYVMPEEAAWTDISYWEDEE